MSHLIKIYTVCKFVCFGVWYLKRVKEMKSLIDSVTQSDLGGVIMTISVFLHYLDSKKYKVPCRVLTSILITINLL